MGFHIQSKHVVGFHIIRLSLHDNKYFAQKCWVRRWELKNIAICRRIGNLKNTHVSAHRSVPRQPYIGVIVHTSEDGPFIRALMFEHASVWPCLYALPSWVDVTCYREKKFLLNLFLLQFKISCLVGVSLHCLRGFCGIELKKKKNLPGEYFERLSRTLFSWTKGLLWLV